MRRTVNKGLLTDYSFDYIVHMGAQAGVRYSLENPQGYIDSNIQGFFNLLEASKSLTRLKHFVYASSSSVYGGSKNLPFSESENVSRPVSLYAATKACNELMAFHSTMECSNWGTPVRIGPGEDNMAAFGFCERFWRPRD